MLFKLLWTTIEKGVAWAIDYAISNCDVHLDTSSTAAGKKIGGHDNVKVPDKFIVLSFYFRGRSIWTGYWEVS